MAYANILRLTTLAALLVAAPTVSAHIMVTSPTPRVPGADNLKSTPCGEGTTWGQGDVLTYAPGDQIAITWEETITHAGYYRVVLSQTGDAGLTMPSEADFDAFTQYYENGEMGTVPDPVESAAGTADGDMLLYYDYYSQHAGGFGTCAGDDSSGACLFSATITLPQACEQCTIQVIQTMAEASRTYGSNAHYYQCIDITIDPTMAAGGGGAGGAAGMAGGGAVEMGGAASMGGTANMAGAAASVAGAATMMAMGGTSAGGSPALGTAGATAVTDMTMGMGGAPATTTATGGSVAVATTTTTDTTGGTATTGTPGTADTTTTGTTAAGGAVTTTTTPGAVTTTTTSSGGSSDAGGCSLSSRSTGSGLSFSGLALAALALVRRRRD